MVNTNLFGVGVPATGSARDLRVAAAWSTHAPHAAHATAGSAAEQRKRRTAAATDASVDGGIV